MNKRKAFIIAVIAAALSAIIYFVANYNYFFGSTVLVAGRENGICYVELTLNENQTFIEEANCLTNSFIKGTYSIQNDTIFFDSYWSKKHTYAFGLITKNKFGNVINLHNSEGQFESQFYIEMNTICI